MYYMNYFMIANTCFVGVCAFFQIIVVAYPFMLLVAYLIVVGYYVSINYHETDGWKHKGQITDIYFSDDKKKMRHFVVYIPNEKNENEVFQHIYASMDDDLLKKRIQSSLIEAVNDDCTTIDIYSCGLLIKYPFMFMQKWYNFENQQLWLGILKQDWEDRNETEEDDQTIPYTLITTDQLDTVKFNSCEIPNLRYIFGQSDHWQIDMKIKNIVYRDVSIYLHIEDEFSTGAYGWFWMYGISINRKLLLDGMITNGDRIYLKYLKRTVSLFNE